MTRSAPPPLHERRRQRKQQQLADRLAACALGLFEAQGYEVVTMEQVAAAADIAKGTLYKYFPVKEALLAHQFQRDIRAGVNALWQILMRQPSFAAQMKGLLHASAKWNEARRSYVAHYARYQFSTSISEDRDATRQRPPSAEGQLFERLCIAGQQRGDVRSDLPAAQLAIMLECLYLGAILSASGSRGRPLKAEFDALLLVALNGVAAPLH